jgi:hypothetical protein
MDLLLETITAALNTAWRTPAGIFAALLPARMWPDLDDRFPVTRCALLSAALTAVAGAALAVYGYLDRLNISILAFATRTPEGWISSYLWWTGVLRTASAVVDEPRGDPLLTMIDGFRKRTMDQQQAARNVWERWRLEGPEEVDYWLPGAEAGVPEAAIVLFASRQKSGWRVGTTVVIGDDWYRLARIDERMVDGRLRTGYALAPHATAEAARDIVYYDARGPAGHASP